MTTYLSQEFLKKYKNKTVPFTPLGEFVYVRTYSRWLDSEKRRETWPETVERTVNYSIGLAAKHNPLLDKQKLIAEAEALYDNMFHLRLFPSGRTLWIGGTAVAEKYPLGNFNCFRRDTEFLTKEGIKTFYDFEDGDIVEVLNGNGAWSPSVVRNYGKQKLLKLVVQRQGTKYTEDIYVTGNHIWFVKKGNEKRYVKVTTSNLKPGDKLRRKVRYENTNLNMCNIGIQHGIVFGDGTFDKKKGHCRVSLIGKKQDYIKYFNNAPTTTEGHRDSTLVYGLPYYFKDLPPISANPEYIKGFLYGLLLTDGRFGSSVRLGQKNLEVVKHLQSMCEIIGLTTSKIVEVKRTDNNLGDYDNIYEFTIHKETLRKHGMLLSEAEEREWIVKEVLETDLEEEVWCVEEPKTNSFTLRGGIHTHNCAFIILDSWDKFQELFYLLMVGAGVGIRILPSDVDKLQPYRTDVEVIMKHYEPVPRHKRVEDTYTQMYSGGIMEIVVGDSKEGWTEALATYFRVLTGFAYKRVNVILFNFDNVRPKGEPLRTFGGTASGHESIKIMFEKIAKVLERAGGKLKPIDVLDIDNIIGENVVVGGVRRTAQIHLFAADDLEVRNAKSNLYVQNEKGEWVLNKEIGHRRMSNNSIFFENKPTREQLHSIMESIRFSGEPGFINAETARLRRDNFNGVNPCGEILLDDRQTCNLSTNNLMAFVSNKQIDWNGLEEALRLTTRVGMRMTLPTLEIAAWDATQKRDRLIGVSLTGYQDCVNALGLTKKSEIRAFKRKLRTFLRDVVNRAAEEYAAELGIEKPLLATTIKPEGTISQLPTVSPGLHYSHSPYYIRRVRINAHDPLVKVCEELGYRIFNEVGETDENCTTKVIEFPVQSPEGITKYDVSAIEQLEEYKQFMEEYVDHNASITIHVRDHEWAEVEEWVYNNWEHIIGISFLSLSDHFYDLAPYESITKEEFEKRAAEMKPFDASLLTKYESREELTDIIDDGCATGACPIR